MKRAAGTENDGNENEDPVDNTDDDAETDSNSGTESDQKAAGCLHRCCDEGDGEIIDVSFDFFPPAEIDFHGLKTLLKQTFAADHELFNLSALADRIIASPDVGSVVKPDGADDPYAIMCVLGFGPDAVQSLPFPKTRDHSVDAIKTYLLHKCKAQQNIHARFAALFQPGAPACALLVSERLVNLPPQLAVQMLALLIPELDAAIAAGARAPFERLIVVSKVYRECGSAGDEFDDSGDADARRGGGGKKSKAKKAKVDHDSAAVFNIHVEDAIYEKFAEIQFDYQFSNQSDQAELMQTAGIKTSRRIYVVKRSDLPAIHEEMRRLLEPDT
ncbi:Mss4p nuclear export [Entophlyctis luteolus]|nr:Mss4p nuclear export [Entophlyctis luteolus]